MSETSIRRPHRRFSEDFKLSVLTDYYSSGLSCNSISRKYNLSAGCLLRWLKLHPFSEVSVSLRPEERKRLELMSQNLPHPPAAGSLEARIAALESENQRLKAALEYSELRVEAFSMAIDYYNKQEWLYRMKRPKGTQETRELISCIVDF